MSTKKTLLILFITCCLVVALVLYNLIINNKRSYSMISLKNFGVCFLVPSDYKIERTAEGFDYKMKHNYGSFRLLKENLSSTYARASVGDFETAYSKVKNDRIVQYKLSNGFIIQDTFVIIKKMQPNLVPLRSKCAKLLEKYPIALELN